MVVSKKAEIAELEISRKKKSPLKRIKKCWELYLIILAPLAWLLIFCYYPMLGAQIAFKDYVITKGIWGSPWVGLKHFETFITGTSFSRVMLNTIILSFYSMIASFPFPIILAISINYIKNSKLRRTVQMVTYAPYFISTVVMVGILTQLLAKRTGIINIMLETIGLPQIDFLGAPENFRHLYVWSGIWQGTGFGAIIYIAALSAIDPTMYEAARIDGAHKFQQIWYIDLPSIIPTAVIMLIMNCGSILSVAFEKVLLLQNPLNLKYSEVIATYTYKVGLQAMIPMYSYSTAVGLFTSVIGLMMLVTVNYISGKLSETSLW